MRRSTSRPQAIARVQAMFRLALRTSCVAILVSPSKTSVVQRYFRIVPPSFSGALVRSPRLVEPGQQASACRPPRPVEGRRAVRVDPGGDKLLGRDVQPAALLPAGALRLAPLHGVVASVLHDFLLGLTGAAPEGGGGARQVSGPPPAGAALRAPGRPSPGRTRALRTSPRYS